MSKSRSEHLRVWHQKRYEQGLCSRCGKPLDRLPLRTCTQCGIKSTTRSKAWYQKQKSIKRCPNCFQFHNTGYTLCDSCRALKNKERTLTNRQRKRDGICHLRLCDHPVGPESTIFCHDHYPHVLELHRKNHDRLVFDGNWETVIKRDNYQCTLCSSTKRLEVHHRDENRKNNDPSNLLTVCHSCHVTITRLLNTPNIKDLLSIVNVQGGS